MTPTRVLIVDDHSLFRKGVRSVLESEADFLVVGEASDGCEAITLAEETKPDIILMDITMPVCSGLEATRQIKSFLPDTRIIILTISEAEADLFEAVKSGAQGYIQKDVNAADLVPALRRAVKGEALLSGLLAAKILDEFRKTKGVSDQLETEPLTEREIEVLRLVASGLSNRQIAKALFLTENTVKHHLSNILGKLHMKSRVQLAIYFHRAGTSKTEGKD